MNKSIVYHVVLLVSVVTLKLVEKLVCAVGSLGLKYKQTDGRDPEATQWDPHSGTLQ